MDCYDHAVHLLECFHSGCVQLDVLDDACREMRCVVIAAAKESHRNRCPHCPPNANASARRQLEQALKETLMFGPFLPVVSGKADKQNEEVHGPKKNDLTQIVTEQVVSSNAMEMG
jgi:hypothetical protein